MFLFCSLKKDDGFVFFAISLVCACGKWKLASYTIKWQCVRTTNVPYTIPFDCLHAFVSTECSMYARCFVSFEYSHLVDMHQLRHRANLTEAMKTTNEWCARMFMCWGCSKQSLNHITKTNTHSTKLIRE